MSLLKFYCTFNLIFYYFIFQAASSSAKKKSKGMKKFISTFHKYLLESLLSKNKQKYDFYKRNTGRVGKRICRFFLRCFDKKKMYFVRVMHRLLQFFVPAATKVSLAININFSGLSFDLLDSSKKKMFCRFLCTQ